MATITSLDEFMDAVITISDEQAEWIVKHFMDRVNIRIIRAIREEKIVSTDVFMAWHHMYSMLATKASREKIRVTAQSVKQWLQ